ncbi:Hypothetical protein PMN2A_1965 [Prochlorococcus marinus str. NATL2A]|uniref:Uncharacterized protein n=1 Tax=Prochlorococcus marinus (strain NATL2A) TaxID=59920 RepID=A7MDG1_PROMT|nr:Hypothetical protein PMN2A_1965 [Prochlorococcus marinus str. NATL2A]
MFLYNGKFICKSIFKREVEMEVNKIYILFLCFKKRVFWYEILFPPGFVLSV